MPLPVADKNSWEPLPMVSVPPVWLMVPLPGTAPTFEPMPLLPMISVALVSVMLPLPLRFRMPVLGSWAEALVLAALRPRTTKLVVPVPLNDSVPPERS